jgi:diacylglycerol kinase family enzyme
VQACVIVNPSARGDKALAYGAGMKDAYPGSVWRRSDQPGHGRELAAQAVAEGFDTIVAAGGDGTVNEIVNGIGDVPGAFEKVNFGVLPLGTIKVLREGRTRAIDLGCAEYSVNGGARKRYFVQLAGAGLDARAVNLVDWGLKKKLGPLAYVAAGLKALGERQALIEGRGEKNISGELILIGNGRFYGGSFPIFPAADMEDGLLDICVLPKVNLFSLTAAVPGMLTGRFYSLAGASHLSAPAITLASRSPVALQLDGDPVCDLPAKLSIRPRTLRVLVP